MFDEKINKFNDKDHSDADGSSIADLADVTPQELERMLVPHRRTLLQSASLAAKIYAGSGPAEVGRSDATSRRYRGIVRKVAIGGYSHFAKINSKSYYNLTCTAVRSVGPEMLGAAAANLIGRLDKGQLVSVEDLMVVSTLLKVLKRVSSGGDAYGDYRMLLVEKRYERRHSKVKMLSDLPIGWANQVFDAVLSDSDADRLLTTNIALGMNCGARPAELAAGVLLSRYGADLKVTIDNKVKTRDGDDRGLGMRWLTFPVDSNSRRYLLGLLGERQEMLIRGMDPKHFCVKMSRVGKALFPGLDESLTPYCLRHQFATDLKAAGWSWETIAMALGHATDKCTKIYGRARGRSDGSLIPAQVGAENTPLQKREPPRKPAGATGPEFGS